MGLTRIRYHLDRVSQAFETRNEELARSELRELAQQALTLARKHPLWADQLKLRERVDRRGQR